jgi:hypothetical protein
MIDVRRHAANAFVLIVGAIPIFAPLDFRAPSREEPVPLTAERLGATPTRGEIRAASDYAAGRYGLVSFATVDSLGRLRGRDINHLYPGASVVKTMVMAAELRRLVEAGDPVDPATRSLLSAMIRSSDNDAADAIYARVGDAGLVAVAERVGMTGFEIAGHWGNAQVRAADMARLFADLDRLLPRRHREFGLGLLGSITAAQSWGIPPAAAGRWAVRFKGGWLPDKALVHQAGELRERGGPREISIAVLTDEQPSHGYGVETVRGVAERLLGGS